MRDYLEEYDRNRTAAVLAMAADLMRGDPETLKLGYSLEDALTAAADCLLVGPMGTIVVGSIALAAHRVAGFATTIEGI